MLMNGRLLLDTNIVIALFAGGPAVQEHLEQAEEVFLPSIVLELGAETALNLDGGGSSTLVMAGHWGPRALNAPFHTRIPMRQRSVANHLGVYALPLEENVD